MKKKSYTHLKKVGKGDREFGAGIALLLEHHPGSLWPVPPAPQKHCPFCKPHAKRHLKGIPDRSPIIYQARGLCSTPCQAEDEMPWSLLSGGLPPTEALTRELPGDDCIKVAAGGQGSGPRQITSGWRIMVQIY